MMSQPGAAGQGAASRAATKASAYGGSEVGAVLGNAVGPPIIGGIVGNLVGEKLGEKTGHKIGLDSAAGRASDDLAKVVGQRNADKLGEITLTALGYSSQEECVCCPCLPASQILLLIMMGFFAFNCYRIGVGIDFEAGCTGDVNKTVTLDVPNQDLVGNNATNFDQYTVYAEDDVTNVTTFIVSYPCEFGFHYLVSGAAVWLVFLPFYITTLLGNCWRQCCCCLCDPLVCFACLLDLIKRYCCECGRFSLTDFIWYSMCVFQVIWGCSGLYWLTATTFFRGNDYHLWDPHRLAMETVLASVILDILLAGSELFHKARLHWKLATVEDQPPGQAYEMQETSSAAGQQQLIQPAQYQQPQQQQAHYQPPQQAHYQPPQQAHYQPPQQAYHQPPQQAYHQQPQQAYFQQPTA